MEPNQAVRPLYIYVDVDDTLVRSIGPKRIPMPAVVAHVRELKSQGATLFCWSTGGADYARETARELGLLDCFDAFLPKPHVILDDQSVADWRTCIHVYPLSCAGDTVATYRFRTSR